MWWQSAGMSLLLIALAEIGDKTQLVCMALAARHGRAGPVTLGAILAFALLNGMAVLFGAALAAWLPESWVLIGMALLFAGFGIHSLVWAGGEETAESRPEIATRGLLVTAFVMIFVAEMGDKTQIAVAGLAGIYPALAVWLGATLGLGAISAVGALAGRTVLAKLPMVWLNRLAGMLFLAMAGIALWRLFTLA